VLIALFIASSLAMFGRYFYAYGQAKSGFPDGFDAVQAAPNSHKVIFENEFVRVLEVTVPPPGTMEPMHHHRWPSFFLDWDTGGGRPHIRYHRPDGSVRDSPMVFFIAKVNQEDLTILGEFMATGRVTPVIDKRYRLGELPEAFRYAAEGHSRGKLIVIPDI
jgi:hypothetical protein